MSRRSPTGSWVHQSVINPDGQLFAIGTLREEYVVQFRKKRRRCCWGAPEQWSPLVQPTGQIRLAQATVLFSRILSEVAQTTTSLRRITLSAVKVYFRALKRELPL